MLLTAVSRADTLNSLPGVALRAVIKSEVHTARIAQEYFLFLFADMGNSTAKHCAIL